jgi:hypothetical protein
MIVTITINIFTFPHQKKFKWICMKRHANNPTKSVSRHLQLPISLITMVLYNYENIDCCPIAYLFMMKDTYELFLIKNMVNYVTLNMDS